MFSDNTFYYLNRKLFDKNDILIEFIFYVCIMGIVDDTLKQVM